jgi:hypothetical protein
VTPVKMLAAKGYIKLENYFVDGTKIESASGRYTFVWKKAVEKNDKKLDAKLRAYIRTAGVNLQVSDQVLAITHQSVRKKKRRPTATHREFPVPPICECCYRCAL